jgi:hypothetical protein
MKWSSLAFGTLGSGRSLFGCLETGDLADGVSPGGGRELAVTHSGGWQEKAQYRGGVHGASRRWPWPLSWEAQR